MVASEPNEHGDKATLAESLAFIQQTAEMILQHILTQERVKNE